MHFTYQEYRCFNAMLKFIISMCLSLLCIKEDPEIFLAFDFALQHSGQNKSILQQAGLKICSPKSLRQAGGVLEVKQVLSALCQLLLENQLTFQFSVGPVTCHSSFATEN